MRIRSPGRSSQRKSHRASLHGCDTEPNECPEEFGQRSRPFQPRGLRPARDRNRQPDVGAQQGGCSDRHFTGASRLDERAVEDAKQLRLDGALVRPPTPLLNQRLASTPRAIVALSCPPVSDSATASCHRRDVTSWPSAVARSEGPPDPPRALKQVRASRARCSADSLSAGPRRAATTGPPARTVGALRRKEVSLPS
jgi:hypothetical protein